MTNHVIEAVTRLQKQLAQASPDVRPLVAKLQKIGTDADDQIRKLVAALERAGRV